VKTVKKTPKKGPNAGKPQTKIVSVYGQIIHEGNNFLQVSADSFFKFFSPKVTEWESNMEVRFLTISNGKSQQIY
jgi:hypothetical protein